MTYINLTFLGTGAAIPTLKRGHPAIHLKYHGRNTYSILFDCGEGTQTKLIKARINFMSIDYIFITHWHADHFIGIYGLLNSMGLEGRKKEIKIFGPKADKIGPELLKFFNFDFKIEFIDTFKEGVVFDTDEFYIESMFVNHSIDAVAYSFVEKDRIKLDKNKIKRYNWKECKELKEKHKILKNSKIVKLEDVCYVVKGKKIVYSGDTKYIPKMKKFCKGADILIHDCTYFNREDVDDKMHSCLDDIIKLRNYANKIYLFHIGRKYTNQKELEKKIKYKNIFIPKDFDKVKI